MTILSIILFSVIVLLHACALALAILCGSLMARLSPATTDKTIEDLQFAIRLWGFVSPCLTAAGIALSQAI
ncbi:hypothetical protein [Pelagovum pacificum]|uniref:Uncharacterized protein n=1 Tax=Pelagovum pacificum TaxID=2588711 RepID=A0A5C5GG54_9RHOB|nr:hypothetical protein [Pelagovum pacificum]QQA43930.1 hypothetical protein I8N54_04955 [Pelagovum pacificum]TNY32941.1 hypothetical protein FHY64_06595 [Pelagovum pacificum]